MGVRSDFDAAHSLRNHPGKCSNIHGHRWEVEAVFCGQQTDNLGILVDFSELKELLEAEVKKYDHKNLNEVHPFDSINPTAELPPFDDL